MYRIGLVILALLIMTSIPIVYGVNATKIQTFEQCYDKVVDIMSLSGKDLDGFKTQIWNFCVSN